MSEDEIVYKTVEGPEKYRTIVNGPMLRAVSADAIIDILTNQENLNSRNRQHTSFYCYNPKVESVYKVGYGDGGVGIGYFVIFPEEANQKPLEKKTPTFSAPNPNILQEIAVANDKDLPNSEIRYSEYTFIQPEDWSDIRFCKNIHEAEEILEKKAGFRSEREEKVIKRSKEYLERKRKVESIMTSVTHPIFDLPDNWVEFYTTFCLDSEIVRENPTWAKKDALKELELLKKIRDLVSSSDNPQSLWRSSIPMTMVEGADIEKISKIDEYLSTIQNDQKTI